MWKRSNDERPIMIGMDFFDRIREEGGYYVDKTALIDRLFERKGVYLFTRPLGHIGLKGDLQEN